MHSLQLPVKLLFIAILLLILLSTTSCATFYKLEGISDFGQIELQEGDSIIISTKDNERMKMVIQKSDSEYFYGEKENNRVRKADIQTMELSRSYPAKFYFSLAGLLLFSFFFSG